jgi:hypothetical protein
LTVAEVHDDLISYHSQAASAARAVARAVAEYPLLNSDQIMNTKHEMLDGGRWTSCFRHHHKSYRGPYVFKCQVMFTRIHIHTHHSFSSTACLPENSVEKNGVLINMIVHSSHKNSYMKPSWTRWQLVPRTDTVWSESSLFNRGCGVYINRYSSQLAGIWPR